MKPFVICVYKKNEVNHSYPVDVNFRELVIYHHIHQSSTDQLSRMDCCFADDEETAMRYAEALARNNNGISVMVAKTTDVFSSVVKEIQTTRAKFTEKGLLPV